MNEFSRIKKETPVKGINNLFEQMFIHTFSTYWGFLIKKQIWNRNREQKELLENKYIYRSYFH